jgi:hypothetical protein
MSTNAFGNSFATAVELLKSFKPTGIELENTSGFHSIFSVFEQKQF